jgi:hypothetical protein
MESKKQSSTRLTTDSANTPTSALVPTTSLSTGLCVQEPSTDLSPLVVFDSSWMNLTIPAVVPSHEGTNDQDFVFSILCAAETLADETTRLLEEWDSRNTTTGTSTMAPSAAPQ